MHCLHEAKNQLTVTLISLVLQHVDSITISKIEDINGLIIEKNLKKKKYKEKEREKKREQKERTKLGPAHI